MRIQATAIALVLAMCGAVAAVPLSAKADDPPMPFSFVPRIYQSDVMDSQCRTPLGAGWFNYLSNRGTVTSTFPTLLGTQDGRNYFTGPICIQFTYPDPRWPTGQVLIWAWSRGVNNHIFASAHEVDCLHNKMARRYYGHGNTVDQVIASTIPVNDDETKIGINLQGAYAVSVCRLLEMFYPGRGAWYDYPQ
jgi:hypothetical protein